jgi:hypothetical protein
MQWRVTIFVLYVQITFVLYKKFDDMKVLPFKCQVKWCLPIEVLRVDVHVATIDKQLRHIQMVI